jgi:hypothetical protein
MKNYLSGTITLYYAASSHMDNYVIMGGADSAAAAGGASRLPQLLGYSEWGGSPQVLRPIASKNQPCTPHMMPLQGLAQAAKATLVQWFLVVSRTSLFERGLGATRLI